MRFLELNLTAVGHFTDVTLPLDTPKPAFHLIYGRNEAGKSTTLRAIRYLLYGFPERTSDNFLHAKPKVGARLALDDVETLEVVRRKGRKRTLLAPDESALDESCLHRALHGVGEAQFLTMFGLDHAALRRGGEALLSGRGNVGESLFDAGTGGRGIHQVLTQLDAEADSLFRPRGRRKLNEAIEQFRDAVRRTQTTGVDPRAARTQRETLEAEKSRKQTLDKRYHRLRADHDAARRDLKLLAPLRERERLRRELETVGPIHRITAEDVQQREELQRELERATVASHQHAEELARLDTRLAQVDEPDVLAEVAGDVIRDIENRRGGLLKALSDVPSRRAELRAHEEDLRRALTALGKLPDLSQLESLRVAKDRIARIGVLAQDRGALLAKHEEAVSALEETQLDRERLQRQSADLPEARDTSELRGALAAADALGDVEQQRVSLAKKQDLCARRTSERLTALGLLPASLPHSDIRSLPVPAIETIERFRREFQQSHEKIHRTRGQIDTAKRDKEEAETKLETLTRGGDVPSEEALDRARAERNRTWGVIRRTLEAVLDAADEQTGPNPSEGKARSSSRQKRGKARFQASLGIERPDPEWFDESLRKSDDLADRLRREAGRVAQHAELSATLRRVDGLLEHLEDDLAKATSQLRETDERWTAQWDDTPIRPTSPEEMRSWHSRFEQWRQTAEELDAVTSVSAELDVITADRAEAIQSALDGLQRAREPAPGANASGSRTRCDGLNTLRQRARTVLDTEDALSVKRRRIEEQLAQNETREKKETQRIERRAKAIAVWQEEWAKAVAPLGLASDARPEEAQAVLDQIDALFKRVEQAESVRRRIDAMKRDEAQFADRLRPLVQEHAPDLASRSLEEQADALVQRHRRALTEATQRLELSRAVDTRREELAKATHAAAAVEAALEIRMREAGVETLTGLVEAEERARHGHLLKTQLEANEAHLRSLTEGEDLEAVAGRLNSVDARDLRIREDDLEREVAAAEEEREALQQEIGRLEHGLEHQRSRSQASQAAADAQLSLSQVRELGHRYVRLKLAATVVRREIDRYRERNQGPVLTRAGELFPRLTAGRYAGLKVGFGDGDEEVLKCVRDEGREVAVAHLSDGSQDQLYLALRLASLERFQAVHGTLPLVLDDVLLHFDEDRARTALAVLGEYSKSGQVLFFTHQARLRELAEEAIAPGQLDLHDLDQLRAGEAAKRRAV